MQFLVITKGASRVSEVSARFALDALPGKQLSINEDLNSGTIDQEEARKRRSDLSTETGFYGSMDGASKFVSGNVIMAVVVLVVDVIGGIIIGMTNGMNIGAAANRYIMLTVGDGLVSQIPALLVSMATGIIVTRNSADEQFSEKVATQLVSLPKTLFITGGAIVFLGFLPGFPMFLCILFGGAMVAYGYVMQQSISKDKQKQQLQKLQESEQVDVQPTIDDILHVDPLSLEVGYGLISLVDKQKGGDLIDRIKMLRKNIGLDLGILVPNIRITDNVSIDAEEYVVKIRGSEIGRGRVSTNRLLAMKPFKDQKEFDMIEGLETKDPAFNLPAKWISIDDRAKAEHFGFDVFAPASVLATHLTDLIRKNSCDLLTRQDVQNMMDALKKEFPVLVSDALKESNISEIHKILQMLLKEKVKIRNMLPILETISDYRKSLHLDALSEKIRDALGRQIVSSPNISENNTIRAIILDPQWEHILNESLKDTKNGYVADLDRELSESFVNSVGQLLQQKLSEGVHPVIVCSKRIRMLVRNILEYSFPDTPVIAPSEIPSSFRFERLGIVAKQ